MTDGTLRRVAPLPIFLPEELPAVNAGKPPELRWVAPTDLYVDELYQRDLNARSIRLISRIVRGFVWRKLKPPIVVETESGPLHCIDGQHTAIAAAILKIASIPVIVVEALTIEDRADAFVGHNRDRIVMDPMEVYRGLLMAKDPDAMDCFNVCQRAGVKLKQLSMQVGAKVGDCGSVGVIMNLIKRRGVVKARKVLEALVLGGRAPIRRVEIDAVEAVMVISRPNVTVGEMGAVVRALGDEGLTQSKVKAAGLKKPQKHILYDMYMTILDKQTERVAAHV